MKEGVRDRESGVKAKGMGGELAGATLAAA
jgi:hypothetical protein